MALRYRPRLPLLRRGRPKFAQRFETLGCYVPRMT